MLLPPAWGGSSPNQPDERHSEQREKKPDEDVTGKREVCACAKDSAFLQHGAAQMAAEAGKARPAFRIFPEIPNLFVRCKIPRGRGGTVPGLCEAKLHGPRRVAFLEHWPLSRPTGHRNTAGWIVTLGRSGRVVGVHGTGPTPPQSQP